MIVLAKVMILKSSKNSVTPMIDIPTCLIVASFEAIASCIVVSVNPSDISTNFSKDIVVCSNPVSFAFTTVKKDKNRHGGNPPICRRGFTRC